MSPANPRIVEITARLRRYCADHPSAADTLNGVQCWWLGTTMPDALADEVETALRLLIAEGLIGRRTLGDGTVLFFSAGRSAFS